MIIIEMREVLSKLVLNVCDYVVNVSFQFIIPFLRTILIHVALVLHCSEVSLNMARSNIPHHLQQHIRQFNGGFYFK